MSLSLLKSKLPIAGGPPWLAVLGLIIAGGAWYLPVNLRSLSPTLLRVAGRGTPSLVEYGRDLLAVDKVGPAALVRTAAILVDVPRAPELASAIEQFGRRQVGLMVWGGWDAALDSLFQLRSPSEHRGSTPVVTLFIPEKARGILLGRLEKSGSEGVQSLLRLRGLRATGRFVPATQSGGQSLEAVILLAGLLYEGQHLAVPLQRELRAFSEAALRGGEWAPLDDFFLNLLSLGRRLDWGQLSELSRRTNSLRTLAEFAHLARLAPEEWPVIYAAALFSDSADLVAAYLIKYGQVGIMDLRMALAQGRGAVAHLVKRQVPVNRSGANGTTVLAELALEYSQLILGLKYAGYFTGFFLGLRGLALWLAGRRAGSQDAAGAVRPIKAGFIALAFSLLFIVVSEPFLLRPVPPSAFQSRLPALISVAASPLSPPTKPVITMDPSTLISIGFFAALQIAMYFVCLMKIREVAGQGVSPLVKLRLMENEENLFDGGLYIGIGGTATALVLQVLGVIEPNLLAAYSSNLFGITCVAVVKIRHVRPFKRSLIMEGQVEPAQVIATVKVDGATLR